MILSAAREQRLPSGRRITEVSWTRETPEPLGSPLVAASKRSAEWAVDEPVYCRSATGGGDAKVLRHEGLPTVEFGLGT